MLKHILQKCVTIALTVGYILCVVLCQKLPSNVVVDVISLLVMGLWLYIILDDFDVKVLSERRVLTKKHIIYEMLFVASLAMITAAYLLDRFGWALAMVIGSVLAFVGGCVMYGYCFKHEEEFTSTEIDNCRHMIFVLKHLKNKTENWTAEALEEYATKRFRFYPKSNHLERTLDGYAPVDPTGHLRTLAEMNEADPNSNEAIIARKRIKEIVTDYVNRREEKEQKKLLKKQKKEAK